MQTNEIQAVIKEVSTNGGTLSIKGYQDTAGGVYNYEVKLIGQEGYLQLIRESLEALKQGKVTKPEDTDIGVWTQAVAVSWEATLLGIGKERHYAEELQPHSDGYHVSETRPELVVLRHLEKVAFEVVRSVEKKAVKSQPKTLAKAFIRDNTPVSKYLGQLNLQPGKVESVAQL